MEKHITAALARFDKERKRCIAVLTAVADDSLAQAEDLGLSMTEMAARQTELLKVEAEARGYAERIREALA